jgi:GTP-binding protein EngB required for normal cell division
MTRPASLNAAPGEAAPHGGNAPADGGKPGLSARLTALARLVQIGTARSGPDGFSPELLSEAEELLGRAGQRLRLSDAHTVVAFAGGTGSGKSSLFNALAGADFSPVGLTRPTTREVHACVWGVQGSGPLLDWLGVPRRFRYARASALSAGEQSLAGLMLLDLPDHDSVAGGASGTVDRMVGLADLIVWVLDPQKYADAAVHRRYLVPLAGHAEVIAVVLNQADVLTATQTEDCLSDLRRLLDAEGLHDAQIIVTSATTGMGLDELRKLLSETVSARQAAAARLVADVDAVAAKFAPYSASPDSADAEILPAGSREKLVQAFCYAAGAPAVAESLRSARELRAVDYVGWPVGWLAERLTSRDPVRKVRLGKLWSEMRGTAAKPSGAQQAEISRALAAVADDIGRDLPMPWSQTVRTALRSRAEEIPAALGTAVQDCLPAENEVPGWWRLAGAWQGLLLGCAIVGIAWIVALLLFGEFHIAPHVPHLFANAGLLPWLALVVVGIGFLGWLTASVSVNLVRVAAQRESHQLAENIRSRVEGIASDLVIMPGGQELSEFRRFADELAVAAETS